MYIGNWWGEYWANNGDQLPSDKLSSYGDLEMEVRDQVKKVNKLAGCINNTIWRIRHINTRWNKEFTKPL